MDDLTLEGCKNKIINETWSVLDKINDKLIKYGISKNKIVNYFFNIKFDMEKINKDSIVSKENIKKIKVTVLSDNPYLPKFFLVKDNNEIEVMKNINDVFPIHDFLTQLLKIIGFEIDEKIDEYAFINMTSIEAIESVRYNINFVSCKSCLNQINFYNEILNFNEEILKTEDESFAKIMKTFDKKETSDFEKKDLKDIAVQNHHNIKNSIILINLLNENFSSSNIEFESILFAEIFNFEPYEMQSDEKFLLFKYKYIQESIEIHNRFEKVKYYVELEKKIKEYKNHMFAY